MERPFGMLPGQEKGSDVLAECASVGRFAGGGVGDTARGLGSEGPLWAMLSC